jgi:hypothetical protein
LSFLRSELLKDLTALAYLRDLRRHWLLVARDIGGFRLAVMYEQAAREIVRFL